MTVLYYTVTRNELRSSMPTVPVLLSAAGWTYTSRGGISTLRVPPLPSHITARGADCGGFVVTMKWGGKYRFTPAQYVSWLMKWRPQWAAVMDLCCLDLDGGYPGKEEVRRRQHFTAKMAYHFWAVFGHLPLYWCPSIQGYHPEEYARHAQVLAPLIDEMYEVYLDTGWTDEEQEQQMCAFRVGIGSLCGRDPDYVHDIIKAVRDVLGLCPLHLWGTKLKFLQSPIAQETVVSLDSSAWNGLWGTGHEARRNSGLSEAQYCWKISYPRYASRVAQAIDTPKCIPLVKMEQQIPPPLEPSREEMLAGLCYRKSGEGPGEQYCLPQILDQE